MIERFALLVTLMLGGLFHQEAVASEIGDIYDSGESQPEEKDDVAPQVALALKLILKGQVTTGQSRLYLKDVASCEGHKAACEELEAVDIGPSPDPGRMRVILRRDIAAAVGRETRHGVSWDGTEIVRVTSDFREIDAATIRDAIQTRLGFFNENLEQTEIRLKQVLALRQIKIRPTSYDITIPEWDAVLHPHDETQSIDDEWAVTHLSSSSRLMLRIQLEGEEQFEELPVRVQLEAFRFFPVATRTLERGATIEQGDLRLEKRRVSPTSRLWLTDIHGLEGKVLRMPLKSGEVPTTTMLATPLIVKRGTIVELAIKTGGVALKGRGRTLMSGAVGDAVDVLYLATKKQLKGRVIGPGTVEVSL